MEQELTTLKQEMDRRLTENKTDATAKTEFNWSPGTHSGVGGVERWGEGHAVNADKAYASDARQNSEH